MPAPPAPTHWITIRGPDPLNGQNTTVSYDQFAEYRERINGKVVESVRFLAVPWPQRFNLIKALLGTARLGTALAAPETFVLTPYGLAALRTWWANNGVPNIANMADITASRLQLNRLLPEPHPELSYLIAVDAEVLEGKGYPVVDSTVNPRALQFYQNLTNDPSTYYAGQGVAKIAVTYKALPYNTQISDPATNLAGVSEITRYVWRQPKPSAQNLPIQGTYFRELNIDVTPPVTSLMIPEPAVKTYPFLRVTYTWVMVPAIPPAMFYMMNNVNQTAFDSGNFPITGVAPIGNAQFLGGEISEPYWTFHGDKVYDIKHTVIFRQPGPNWRFRPRLGYFRLALANVTTPLGGGVPVYSGAGSPPLPSSEPFAASSMLFNYAELDNLFKLGTIGARTALAI